MNRSDRGPATRARRTITRSPNDTGLPKTPSGAQLPNRIGDRESETTAATQAHTETKEDGGPGIWDDALGADKSVGEAEADGTDENGPSKWF